MKIVHKYIVREVLVPFLLSLVVITFVLLLVRILRVADLVINKGVSLKTVFMVLGNMSLFLLSITVPVSFMTAVLLGLGRLSSENEILAMRTLGISINRIVSPILIMAAVISVILIIMQDRVFPALQQRTDAILRSLSTKSHKMLLREKEFIEGLGNYIFFIHSISGDKLRDIIVYEPVGDSTARIITAREGKYQMLENDKLIAFHLLYGTFDEPKSPESKTFYKMKFDSYIIKIPLEDTPRALHKNLKEMTFFELIAKKRTMAKEESFVDTRPIYNEFFKRITLSFSILILTILAIPLSIKVHRSEKSVNFALALGVIVFYYVLLAAGEAASLKGVLHPSIMTSLPNIVLGIAGVFLYLGIAKK